MSAEEWEAWLDHLTGEDEPFDPEEYADPDGPPPPGEDELTAVEVAEIPEATEAEARAAVQAVRSGATGALAVIAASAGRRGPGQPGSAGQFPRESGSRAAGFGAALALDVMPGGPDLALLADAAAGRDDRYQGASDDELIGVLCAWDRLEAHMAARKLAAAAELIRRRPEPGCALAGAARMPEACEGPRLPRPAAGQDSRPRQDTAGGQDGTGGPDGTGPGGGGAGPGGPAGSPAAGPRPAQYRPGSPGGSP